MQLNRFSFKNPFALNRFDFTDLINEIQHLSTLPDLLTDTTSGIEIYISNGVQKEWLIDVLTHFNEMDNQIQQKNQSEWKKFHLLAKDNRLPHDDVHKPLRDIRYFQMRPFWIKVSDDNVTVDYAGDTYNTDWCVVFQRIDGVWHFREDT